MGKRQTVIELNGKAYDAITGQIIEKVAVPARKMRPAVRAVDGFITRPQPLKPVAQPAAKSVKTTPVMLTPRRTAPSAPVMDVKPAPARTARTKNPIRAHKAEPAKTLMRRTVAKPAPGLKRTLKVQARISAELPAELPQSTVAPKLSYDHLDEARLKRAKHIAKHEKISRFGYVPPAVKQVSAKKPVGSAARPLTEPVRRQPAVAQKAPDIFEQALARASAHEQKPLPRNKRMFKSKSQRAAKRRKRRATSVAATALAILLIGGFIAYQNKANIAMEVASSKAGFHAELPGWHPGGFAAGAFQYKPGFVAVNYQSSKDKRSYTLSQQVSNWDSNTLLNDFVAAKNPSYQTVQAAGRTVYIYGDNNATWVSHGIHYNLKSHNSLSTNELVQIATST